MGNSEGYRYIEVPERGIAFLEEGQHLMDQAPFDQIPAVCVPDFFADPQDWQGIGIFVRYVMKTRPGDYAIFFGVGRGVDGLTVHLAEKKIRSSIVGYAEQTRLMIESTPYAPEYLTQFLFNPSVFQKDGTPKDTKKEIPTFVYYQRQKLLSDARYMLAGLEEETHGLASPGDVSDAVHAAGRGRVNTNYRLLTKSEALR